MAWTYDTSQLASSKLMQVRYLVGDTRSTDQQVEDEEINFLLNAPMSLSIWRAAAQVCRSLATQLSREADTVDKDLRTTLSARAKAYSLRAVDYDVKAQVRGGGAMPYAGGISIADKIINELDPDRVPPQFTIDMDDNYLPVAPVGNEGTPTPDDDNSDG